MCLDTNPENRVLGIQGGLEHHAPLPSIQEAGEDQEGMQECERITVRRLGRLIGLLTSTIPAVLPAPLHYRALQLLKGKAIRNSRHNYNTVISLDEDPCSEGSRLVDCSGIRIQWQTYHTPKGRENSRVRCFDNRLGSQLPGSP